MWQVLHPELLFKILSPIYIDQKTKTLKLSDVKSLIFLLKDLGTFSKCP